jgi:hypothetical protein
MGMAMAMIEDLLEEGERGRQEQALAADNFRIDPSEFDVEP